MSKSSQSFRGTCSIPTLFLISLSLFLSACSQGKQDGQQTRAGITEKASKTSTNIPAKVSAPDGIDLFTEASTSSSQIKSLPVDTTVWVLDEINDPAKGHWYRLKTKSGTEGWSQGEINRSSPEEVEHEISADKQAFEDKLKRLILDAVVQEINEKKPNPLSSLVSKKITSPLTPSGDNSYSVDVSCLMVERFPGNNRSRLDLKVDLFLEIDKDSLASSDARIKNVAIVNEQEAEQMPVGEDVSLLKSLMP